MSTETALTTTGKVDIESLISMGITQKLTVDVMEKLFLMRQELKKEYAKEQYFKALAKFQSETPAIEKTEPVMVGGKLRYSYAPLDVIVSKVKDPLMDNGFSYQIKTVQTENKITVTCEAHHIEGHTENTSLTMDIGKSGYMSSNQEIGSALSFGKRYCFCDAFGILTGDGDIDAVSDKIVEGEIVDKKEEPKKEQQLPAILEIKVTEIKDNLNMKKKDDKGNEVLSHNKIYVEKNCYDISNIGVSKDRTDKNIKIGSIVRFENLKGVYNEKYKCTFYNATEVNEVI